MKVIKADGVCPMVVMDVFKEWNSLQEGQQEEVLISTDWEAAALELEKWCKETGNEYKGYNKEGNRFNVTIRLVKKQPM